MPATGAATRVPQCAAAKPGKEDQMESLFVQNRVALAVRGAVAITFGIAALVLPEPTLAVLIALVGAFFLADGLFSGLTALYFAEWRVVSWPPLIEAIVAIGIGLITFFWPNVTALFLLYLLAAWAVLTGLMQLIATYQLRRYLEREWLLALRGLAPLLCGVVLILFPRSGALALLRLIGIGALLLGGFLLYLAVRLNRRLTGQTTATSAT